MLSKAQNKYIRALSQQKNRDEQGLFVVEGDKMALEWLNNSTKVHTVVALKDWVEQNQTHLAAHPEAEIIVAEPHQLQAVSNLQTAHNVLLVVHKPHIETATQITDWCIALDDIQDPGNMGTILRIADWFGIRHVFASFNSVDYYNPKVVQAAMGAHLRVQLHSCELNETLSKLKLPVYAAMLNGENVYNIHEPKKGVILIGNEAKGVSTALEKVATHKITIPRIGGAESLNAAVSTGIVCALLIKP